MVCAPMRRAGDWAANRQDNSLFLWARQWASVRGPRFKLAAIHTCAGLPPWKDSEPLREAGYSKFCDSWAHRSLTQH